MRSTTRDRTPEWVFPKGCEERLSRPGQWFPNVAEALTDGQFRIDRPLKESEWGEYLDDPDFPNLDDDVEHIFNQRSVGSCASEATTQALAVVRSAMGLPFELLNPYSVFIFVGSRYGGSTIDSNWRQIQQHGVCLMSDYGRGDYPRRPSDEAMSRAKQFRALEVADITSDAEFVTANILQWPVVFGRKGHAMCRTRTYKKNGVWRARGPNSWKESWGDRGFFDEPHRMWDPRYGAFAIVNAVDNT